MEKLAQTDNEYMAKVPVTIYGGPVDPLLDIDNSGVSIRFRIEIEARSWGIKDFVVTLIDNTVQIPIIVTRDGISEDKVVLVDLTQLRQTRIQSGSVTLTNMELVLDKDFRVDYKRSSIDVLS